MKQNLYVAKLERKVYETFSYVNVYANDESGAFAGQYTVSNFKGPRVIFHEIVREGTRYALVSNGPKVQVYSLPEMELVAETYNEFNTKIVEIYCPNLQHEVVAYDIGKEESVAHYTYSNSQLPHAQGVWLATSSAEG